MKLTDLKRWIDSQLSTIITSPEQVSTERNILLWQILNIPVETLFQEPLLDVPETEACETLQSMLHKRIHQRIPLQYLVGETSFFGLTFKVTPHVLIPRPETELLVEKALEYCRSHSVHKVIDLGTGSGCIAVTIKKQMPQLAVTATDLSAEALAVAQENAARHLTDIRFLQGSWFQPVSTETFDLILSNPPYIHQEEQSGQLTPEVLQEPAMALFPPEAPEVLYEKLVTEAQQHLSSGGAFFFEIGHDQADALMFICHQAGIQAEVFTDYAGIPRILAGVVDEAGTDRAL